MRALSCEIYLSRFGDCSNHGISSKYKEILLVCDDGNVEIDENNPPENLCKVVTRDLGFRVYTHVEPVAKANGVGWMASGAIVHTSDSRFPFDYPLRLHDRTESREEYAMYSI